jgi:single-strand DNA-binding protein
MTAPITNRKEVVTMTATATKKATEPEADDPGAEFKSSTTTLSKTKGPITVKTGNLVEDPVLRFAASGKAYARMRIAVEVPLVPGNWAGGRSTAFYDVTAFSSLAEHAAECLAKGDRIVVTGSGESRTWIGEDGKEHSGKGILADSLGPDLRWITVEMQRTERKGAAEEERGEDVVDIDF